jgi:hypothetical protein
VSGSSSLPSRDACAAFVALAVLLALETTAWAAARARLVYDRAPTLDGCVDEAHMRQAIAVRVGYDPIDPGAPDVLTISIVRTGEQLVADVTLANRDGQRVGSRTLQAPARPCDELTAAIALTVAIALDAIDKGTPADPSAPPTASSSPTSSPTSATEPAPDTPSTARRIPQLSADGGPVVRTGPEEPPRPSPRLELGVGMSGAPLGVSPVFAVSAAAFASVSWSRIDIGVEGSFGLAASGPVKAVPGASVRTSWSGGGPTACLHFGPYFGCAVAFVGSLRAEAPGVSGASSGHALEILAGPRAGVAVPLGLGASLRLALDVLADAPRPGVRAGGQTLWQASPVVAAAQAAVAFEIP